MQIPRVHHNHRVVVRGNFNTLLPNEKQLDIPHIHATITTLLIIYNSPLTAVFLSESKCWSTATAVQLNPLQLHRILVGMDRTGGTKMCERNHNRASRQELTARNREGKKVSSGQSKRREAREQRRRGSLGKDRQKDRISLSHSWGGGNKRHLQREWDRVRDSLEKKKCRGSKFITKNSHGVML